MSLLHISSDTTPDLKIGELAKRTAKTQRALRLYEEMGLLTPTSRSDGNFRLYDASSIERVRFISKLQELGFTLPQIQELVRHAESGDMPRHAMGRVRALYAEKRAEIEAQIARLQELQRELTSSLSYLETCVSSCTAEGSAAACCCTCETHGENKAPSLVEGTRS